MLKEIYIQNYALMDELRVGFPGKMTVITGETGAGKSILLGALGLILGKRADTSVLNDKSKKCIVEAVFKISTYRLQDFFKTNDLDYSDETTMRRELSVEGKSRAFINDTPVNLNLMKALGELLIDIHSQHETLMLSEKNFRFDVMDAFARVEPELVVYRDLFKKFKNKERILEQLKKDYSNVKKDQDYFSFQLSELEEFNLDGIDFDSIKNLSIALENSEFIKGNLSSAAETIAGGEKNILNSLSLVKHLLSQIKKYGNDYLEFESRLNTVILELKELERDLSSYSDRIEYNSEKLDELNEKIDRINKLFIKHQVADLPALILVRDEISNKLQSTESLEKDISKLEKELSSDLSSLKDQAAKISLKRKNKTVELQKSVEQILDKLNMPNARFKVELNSGQDLNLYGCDDISFLFSANKGGDFKELHKVASGGELSRLMLSIKYVIASFTALPTILFDEIDTGVSGEVGARIGNIIEEMSSKMQVISITHLPQIAGRGNHHLLVYKKDVKNKTFSFIRELDKNDRIEELAKMLSSGKPTKASLQNAEELLQQSNN